MSNTAITSIGDYGEDADKRLGAFLPVDPFRSLNVHFGMLLGVDDFETVDAYHRGKMWLHSAWLHRAGTIWGLRVTLAPEKREVQVAAGLALDGLGRELYLARDACLDIGRWFEEHRDEPEVAAVVVENPDGSLRFDAHVVMAFKGCLARQVPALSEPCDAAGTSTAYSRVVETAELLLLPGRAPQWREPAGSLPYHRLRLLFALEDPLEEEGVVIDADQEVLDARAAVLALPTSQQPAAYLEALRRLAALDSMEMLPAKGEEDDADSLFPAVDPAYLPLADCVEITLKPVESGWQLTGGQVDNTIRPVHLATATIQELLCGPLCQSASSPGDAPSEAAPGEGADAPQTAADAGGPRIDAGTVKIEGEAISFEIQGSTLLKASVDPRSFSVTAFDNRDGWVSAEIRAVDYHVKENRIVLNLRDAPGGNLVRLIVKGTGPYPLLGRNRIPFAGAVGGAAAGPYNGHDFVYMLRIRSAS